MRIHGPPFYPGTDHLEEGTMGVDVIVAELGVVFYDEDHRAFPNGAFAHGFHQLTHGVVIVGHHRPRRAILRIQSHGVIPHEAHHHESWNAVARGVILQHHLELPVPLRETAWLRLYGRILGCVVA